MSGLLHLHSGRSSCVIAPDLGGALLRLELDGIDVLRQAPQSCANVLETACFPLVPFANRLTQGQEYAGRVLNLPPDPEGFPNALHGHGWRRSWEVEQTSPTHTRLIYQHEADEWPWSYRATQEFGLNETALRIDLEVTNLSATDMPCGFGIHPYFALEPDSFIATVATACLAPDGRGVPRIESPWNAGRIAVAQLPACDNLLIDQHGSVCVGTDLWKLEMIASKIAGWQFYRPTDGDYFCLEPVSHRPDCLPAQVAGGEGGRFRKQAWQVEYKLKV